MQDNEQKVKEDFKLFLFLIWKHLMLPDPTQVQYNIAHYLQHGPRRCVIEAFRGIGKSWITSAYVVWCLYRDPQMRIMVVSASKERADAFSSFTKRLIAEVDFLQHLKPSTDQRNSMIAFDVGPALTDHSPSVKSVGITGQLTGSRANLIIADDIEVANNSATQTQRDKLSELIKEFDAVLKPGGRIIYLGTPQTEMSIYNQLPERGYEIRVWPALYPTVKQVEMYMGRLAPFIYNKLQEDADLIGRSTDPARFTDADLAERAASYGKAGFALQFMLDTTLSDADKYPLKLADLVVMNLNPRLAPTEVAWSASPSLVVEGVPNVGFTGDRYYRPMWVSPDMVPYTGTVMAIDPAGRGKDETSYAVVKMLNGNLYLVDAGGFHGGYSEPVLTRLAKVAKQWEVNEVITESNFGDGMFDQLLKPYLTKVWPCALNAFNDGKGVRSTQQKEKRIIDTLEPVMMQHRLVIDEKLIRYDHETASDAHYGLFYQMCRLTAERGSLIHDDRLDALSMAVAYWVDQMDADQAKQAKAHKDEMMNKELEKFIQHATGFKQSSRNWMNL